MKPLVEELAITNLRFNEKQSNQTLLFLDFDAKGYHFELELRKNNVSVIHDDESEHCPLCDRGSTLYCRFFEYDRSLQNRLRNEFITHPSLRMKILLKHPYVFQYIK